MLEATNSLSTIDNATQTSTNLIKHNEHSLINHSLFITRKTVPLHWYLQTKLNDEQFAAAIHNDTSSLILAWAGSGKTRTLTYKIANLIFGQWIAPHRILAVTFTNKAAKEMKERLSDLSEEIITFLQSAEQATPQTTDNKTSENNDELDFDSLIDDFSTAKQEDIQQAQTWSSIPEISPHSFKRIGTFHSTFLKILKNDIEWLERGYTKQFGIYDSNETLTIIKKLIKDRKLDGQVEPREAKSFISKMKNEGIDDEMITKHIDNDQDVTMGKIYQAYQAELLKSNSLDFDDLLLLPYLLFKKNRDTLEKRQQTFDFIMVDEAQDTNRIQFELMKMLSHQSRNITLIGDDFQSIYGRRGALMENFLNVKMYRPDIQMFKLQTNYRSRPHIVHAWSHIIQNNQKQYKKDIKAHRDGNDKIMIFTHRDQNDEAINTLELIQKLKKEKDKQRNDFAILYRTNGQSSILEQMLVQEAIPYKIFGAFKFFERKEVKDIVSYLKYLLNPKDNVAIKRIINTPNRKIGKTTLTNIEEHALVHNVSLHDLFMNIDRIDIKVTPAAKAGINQFSSIMKTIKAEISTMSPSDVISEIAQKINYKDFLIKEEGNEQAAQERYDNIGQLINMAEKYETPGEDTLRQMMEEIALMTDAAESGEESDSVKLMTVHASKWLEFPHVFVVWLEENVFPLTNARLETSLLEEERRLMYVAVTRAKDHVFLSHANSRMQRWQLKYNPPSRFLEEIPEDLTKRYDLAGNSWSSWWGYWSYSRSQWPSLSEWDLVKHKLFGEGEILEVRNNIVIVRFENPQFGVRKIESRMVTVM